MPVLGPEPEDYYIIGCDDCNKYFTNVYSTNTMKNRACETVIGDALLHHVHERHNLTSGVITFRLSAFPTVDDLKLLYMSYLRTPKA